MYRQSMPRILKRNFHVNLQQEAKHQNRHYANTTTTNINLKRSNPFKIHMIGGTEYDALKQIRMVQLPSLLHPNPKTLAYTYVKRNIIFGTTRISSPLSLLSSQDPMTQHDDGGDDDDYNNTILIPILQRALEEASKEGDQPQGLATLYGLCQYVKYTLDHPETSLVMQSLLQESNQKDEGSVIYHAVKAVATLIPRQEGIQNLPDHLGKDDSTSTSTSTTNSMITPISPSNSTIGWGTYLDARGGWTKLAKEYGVLSKEHDIFKRISSESGNRRISEPQLFQQLGGVLIHVEYIGQDENPEYWKDAGGSMARFFFL